MDQVISFAAGAAIALIGAWVARRWQRSDAIRASRISNIVAIEQLLMQARQDWTRYYGPSPEPGKWVWATPKQGVYERMRDAIETARVTSMALPPSPCKRELDAFWEYLANHGREGSWEDEIAEMTKSLDICGKEVEALAEEK